MNYYTLILLAHFAASQVTNYCTLPREPQCADNLQANSKSLGSSCTANIECVTPAVCISGKCACQQGMMQTRNGTCVVEPQWQQACVENKCAAPIICSSAGICDQCPLSMTKTRNGCTLTCTGGKVPGSSSCLTAVTRIGDACTESAQCIMAFSVCVNSKCACTQGTTTLQDNTGCTAKPMCAHGGQPYISNGVVQHCRALPCPKTLSDGTLQYDDCPTNYRCYFSSWQVADGVCCPVESAWCPTGEPLLNKKCGAVNVEDERCPSATHECYAGFTGRQYCCPKPCPNLPRGATGVIVNGVCYERRKLGEMCSINEQCPVNAQCQGVASVTTATLTTSTITTTMTTTLLANDRTCQCVNGFVRQWTSNALEICAKRCGAHEVAIGGGCFSPALPLGQCAHSEQCVGDSLTCRAGKCQCICGLTLLGGKCVQLPSCPMGGAVNRGMQQSVAPLSDNQSVYECIPATTNSGPNTCASVNGYCLPFRGSRFGGVCCPLPVPSCLDDMQPQQVNGQAVSCTLGTGSECGPSYVCYDYVATIVGPLTVTGIKRGACCPPVGNRRPPLFLGR